MSDKRITLPFCPHCGAEHEAVGRYTGSSADKQYNAANQVLKWKCFACDATGTAELILTTDPIPGA